MWPVMASLSLSKSNQASCMASVKDPRPRLTLCEFPAHIPSHAGRGCYQPSQPTASEDQRSLLLG